jgi:hypothetical protein
MAGNRVITPFLVIVWQTSSLTALNPAKRQLILSKNAARLKQSAMASL